jgi:hypothetical protein
MYTLCDDDDMIEDLKTESTIGRIPFLSDNTHVSKENRREYIN